ncbi:MAG: SRPBCC family protein [Balneolaceae bacterium]
MKEQDSPVAKSEMLIRKPVKEVFEALVNPDITSRFWFTKGSDRLEPGKSVTWEWEQFDLIANITVLEVMEDTMISFQWPADEEGFDERTVIISFEPRPTETTLVRVVESGFDKDDEHLIETIAGQTGGWALVLSALKAWLEHDIILKVIEDHISEEHVSAE